MEPRLNGVSSFIESNSLGQFLFLEPFYHRFSGRWPVRARLRFGRRSLIERIVLGGEVAVTIPIVVAETEIRNGDLGTSFNKMVTFFRVSRIIGFCLYKQSSQFWGLARIIRKEEEEKYTQFRSRIDAEGGPPPPRAAPSFGYALARKEFLRALSQVFSLTLIDWF